MPRRLGNKGGSDDDREEWRRRRTQDMRECRDRQRRGVSLESFEIGPDVYSLLIRFAELPENKVRDRRAVRVALGKLWRRMAGSFLREIARGQKIL